MSYNKLHNRVTSLGLSAALAGVAGCAGGPSVQPSTQDLRGPVQPQSTYLAPTIAERNQAELAEAAARGVCRIDQTSGAITLLDRTPDGGLTPRFRVAGAKADGTGRPGPIVMGDQIFDVKAGKLSEDIKHTLFVLDGVGICKMMIVADRNKTPSSLNYKLDRAGPASPTS